MSLLELDERSGHGITVTLLYDDVEGDVVLCVADHLVDYVPVVVEAGLARDAFDHPYLYVGNPVIHPPEPQSLRAETDLEDLLAAAAREWEVEDGGEEALA